MSFCATHSRPTGGAYDVWCTMKSVGIAEPAEARPSPVEISAKRRELLLLVHADFPLFGAGTAECPGSAAACSEE